MISLSLILLPGTNLIDWILSISFVCSLVSLACLSDNFRVNACMWRMVKSGDDAVKCLVLEMWGGSLKFTWNHLNQFVRMWVGCICESSFVYGSLLMATLIRTLLSFFFFEFGQLVRGLRSAYDRLFVSNNVLKWTFKS